MITEIAGFTAEREFYADTYKARHRYFNNLIYCLQGMRIKEDGILLYKLLVDKDVTNRKNIFKRHIKLVRLIGKIRRNRQNYVISEGIVQCILEVLDCFHQDKIREKRYLWGYFTGLFERLDSVYFIILQLDWETAEHRIINRTGVNNSVDKMNISARQLFMKNREQNAYIVVDFIIKVCNRERYILIDASREIKENTEKIKNFITGTMSL